MFDDAMDYPTAVASYDDDGVTEAIRWCASHMEKGDTSTTMRRTVAIVIASIGPIQDNDAPNVDHAHANAYAMSAAAIANVETTCNLVYSTCVP